MKLFIVMSKVNMGTLPSTQNTFSVLLDSVCAVTAMITKCDKSQNATARIPELSQLVHLGVHPQLLWNLSEQLCFEPSQNATVTNCDNSGILAVAFCDLSHFVIMAVTAQNESNNTETCSGYLGEYPCSFLTWIWEVSFCPFGRYFTIISVCVYVYQL